MSVRRHPIPDFVLVVGVLLVASVCSAPALAQTAVAPHWRIESHTAPTNLPVGGEGIVIVDAANIGDAEVDGRASKARILDALPANVTEVTKIEAGDEGTPRFSSINGQEFKEDFLCTKSQSGSAWQIECTYDNELAPFEQLEILAYVKTRNASSEEDSKVTVEDGGAPSESVVAPIKVNGATTSFGVETYELTPENESFEPDTEAGSHPFQLTTTFNLNETLRHYGGDVEPQPSAPALEKNLSFELPPGLIGDANVVGNPDAVQQCSDLDFGVHGEADINACPEDTAVGVASVEFEDPIPPLFYDTKVVPVFNLVPAPGEPARFGFEVNNVPVVLDTALRTGDDYGVTVSVQNASEAVQVLASRVTFWGVPTDKRHDGARGWQCLGAGSYVERITSEPRCANPEVTSPTPFLTLPSTCESLASTSTGRSWDGESYSVGEIAPVEKERLPIKTAGCQSLDFEPSIEVKPDTDAASTPTGMSVKVTLPQQGALEAEGKAEADLSATTLELPEGLQTSAGAANGLASCSVQEIGFNQPANAKFEEGLAESAQVQNNDFSALPATCVETSKIGTVSINTPDLEEELHGSVYLASQDTNPFASPLVLYIVAKEKKSEVLVKLAGEVQINQTTGQLISIFKNTPQAPFESLTLELSNTERAAQATPARCGSYEAKATFTRALNMRASGEVETTETQPRSSSFQITSGPNGTACPGEQLPFEPTFSGGATNPQAGAFTPFTVTIGRPDGNQSLEKIDLELPPGMAALISSVELCPNPQAIALETTEEPACPAASQIGNTTVLSGLGGKPVELHGKVYLTEGYAGAPFGLLVVTEAKAGPFNLGFVNVLSQILVNKETAAVTVLSERIPQMLKGVPAQVKELNVTVERPGNQPFEFNPTNCEGLNITGKLKGYEAGSSGISEPFHPSNCAALPFTPTLTATVLGHGSKADGTEFKVTVESKGLGQANIHKVDLTLPDVLPSRLTTIQKACLAAVFNANPAACDEGSDIGEGVVYTPVLKHPLRGPAYLVSHGNAEFPDIEFVLQGEGITLIVDGKTDIKKGITYSRFETAPDAPFTKFETILPAGPHSALTADVPETENFSLCKHASSLAMPTTIVAQNGKTIVQSTKITLVGCGSVLGSKAKKLSRAQHLAKALKVCRTKYRKNKSKRAVCERLAHKKYGQTHKKKSSKKK
ncbi:MAG TPA: hypothetical protein VK680_10985 [Solirubrobacteraceae bacterium]|jgi:hypothetical protein|nr:hypothetical protein [Solirubrobacteraceae bacterium]